MSYVISSISFSAEGAVLVAYLQHPEDVRNEGMVIMQRQLQIAGPDYEDEIEDVRDAIKRLLDDALEDFAVTPAVDE